jgi:hypothetical protein
MSPWDGGPSRVSHQLSAQIRLNPLIRANFWQQKRLTSSRPAPIWNTQNNEIVVNQLWITWGLYHTKCKRSIRKPVVVQDRRLFGVRSREVLLCPQKDMAAEPSYLLEATVVRVPPGVLIQNSRVQPDDVGLFLSKLRFESQVHKSQAEELIGHKTTPTHA